jgi:hypothetical protein
MLEQKSIIKQPIQKITIQALNPTNTNRINEGCIRRIPRKKKKEKRKKKQTRMKTRNVAKKNAKIGEFGLEGTLDISSQAKD